MSMTINEVIVTAKIFYGTADAIPSDMPFEEAVNKMRAESEYRFQIAREKCHLGGYTKDFETFTAFMAA
jgi:hypothetical protein